MKIKMLIVVAFIIMLCNSCNVAPSYDSAVNEQLAKITVNANDIAKNCPNVTSVMIHTELEKPALELQYMTKHTNKYVYDVAIKMTAFTIGFETLVNKYGQDKTYCVLKANNIQEMALTLLGHYGDL